jgi:hypothetical protein
MVKQTIKNFLKKYFYIVRVWNKFTPSLQIAQIQLYHLNCLKVNYRLVGANDMGI